MIMSLSSKKCVPCEGGALPLTENEAKGLLAEISGEPARMNRSDGSGGWRLEGNKIAADLTFKDFKEAMEFVNKVAGLAEKEGHHPDIAINYSKVRLVLWTHAIGGLSENDFILAAKIDEVLKSGESKS